MSNNVNLLSYQYISTPFVCKEYYRAKETTYNPRLHHHEHCEIVYCTEGICTCIVEATKYHLYPGDLLVIYPNEPHRVGLLENFCKYSVLQFLPTLLNSNVPTVNEYAYTLLILQKNYNYNNYIPASKLSHINIGSIIEKLRCEFSECSFGYELAMRAYITELMLHLIRLWKKEHFKISKCLLNEKHNAILQKAIIYIEDNYQDIGEEKLAKSIGVSTSHLSRLFKSELNTSFSSFVNSVKLKEAEKMLLTTTLNITEISLTSGFDTTAYFIKLFKNKHGVTPLQYRKAAEKIIQIKYYD